MSLKGPFSVDKRTPLIINDSTGATATNVPQRDLAHELCALLNAGWEARQQVAKKSPEQRIADDLGIPVEKLMAIAAEEASAAKMTPGTLPEDAEYWTSGDPDDPEDLPQIVLTRGGESIGIIFLYQDCRWDRGGFLWDDDWKRITRDEAADLWRKAIARQAEQEVRDFCAQPQHEPGVSQGDR